MKSLSMIWIFNKKKFINEGYRISSLSAQKRINEDKKNIPINRLAVIL